MSESIKLHLIAAFVILSCVPITILADSDNIIAGGDYHGPISQNQLLNTLPPDVDIQEERGVSKAITSPGFYWGHCQSVIERANESRTWCYFKEYDVWIWSTDLDQKRLLLECGGTAHWCGINVTSASTSSFSWSEIRIFEN